MMWIVSTRSLISKFSSPCTIPMVMATNATITIPITITFMFQSFFQFPSKVLVFIYLFAFIQSYPVVSRNGKIYNSAGSLFFFLLIITRFDRLAEIRWPVCLSKSQIILCVSFLGTASGLWIYYLVVCSNLDFLHNSKGITFLAQSYLVLYSHCVNLLRSLIMWLIVSSLSPHNLHLLFSCTLSILALI